MISLDEEALVCDFAEYYRIYDYRELAPTRAALLAVGLRDSSRIKKRISGQDVSTDTMLLMAIYDRVSWLAWAKTEDGQKGRNRPASLVAAVLKEPNDIQGFTSGKDFLNERNRILKREVTHGN